MIDADLGDPLREKVGHGAVTEIRRSERPEITDSELAGPVHAQPGTPIYRTNRRRHTARFERPVLECVGGYDTRRYFGRSAAGALFGGRRPPKYRRGPPRRSIASGITYEMRTSM